MAYWGSGTSADPYVCDSFSSLMQVCGNYVNTTVYVEMATKDQQGNPIPVEDRVMDFRKSNWYIGSNNTSSADGYNGGWAALAINGPKVVDGKDWVILGISLRDCHLFYFKTDTEGTRTLKNFIIKNAYLQGHSSLVAEKAYGARLVNLSNIKASGVLDMSTVSSPATDLDNLGLFTLRCQTTDYNPYFRITKCSFNFKFITLFKSSCFRSNNTLGARFEFNNCLFNIEGKVTAGLQGGAPAISDMLTSNTMFFGKFYFCKFSGSIYYDHGNSNVYMYLYKNYAGTLDVIDFDIYPLVSANHYNYTSYIIGASTINTNKIIQYCKPIYLHGDLNGMNYSHPTNSAPFLHPTDRTEMCNEQWLTEKGFIIGSPPVE